MTKPLAYLALPGVSFTSLLANLPSIVNQAGGHPTILIDTHDYDRFRGRVTLEKGNSKIQHLGMIYAELLRRGDIHLIDYRRHYSVGEQEDIIQANRSLLETASEEVNRTAAMKAASGWKEFGRGAYQGPFRTGLGENLDEFSDSRKKIKTQRKKMDSGTGDPVGWNERVLNQYMAALQIRENVEHNLNYRVKYIIGQGESPAIDKFQDADVEVPSTGRFLHTDIDAIKETREVLDQISDAATKMGEVDHNDWVLGPTVTIPRFDNISDFSFRRVRRQTRHDLDVDTLIAEAEQARAVFDKRATESPPLSHIEYEAERIGEESNMSSQQIREVLKQLDHAVDLANCSPELRNLVDTNEISQAAIFLAASVESDPIRRYEENAMYRRCVDFMQQVESSSVASHQIEDFRNRGSFRRQGDASQGGDWYQFLDRPPVNVFSMSALRG